MDNVKSYSKLLLATDGSKEAIAAAAHATSLAKSLGAKIVIVYVVNTHNAQRLGVHMAEAVRELAKEGQTVVDEAVNAARAAGAEAEGMLLDGVPGRAIVAAAEELGADMVIIGATGKSGLQEMLLGSVSGYVADHAKRPVLIVRA